MGRVDPDLPAARYCCALKQHVAGQGPVEEVELIPMGCARLRISWLMV